MQHFGRHFRKYKPITQCWQFWRDFKFHFRYVLFNRYTVSILTGRPKKLPFHRIPQVPVRPFPLDAVAPNEAEIWKRHTCLFLIQAIKKLSINSSWCYFLCCPSAVLTKRTGLSLRVIIIFCFISEYWNISRNCFNQSLLL